MLPKSYICITWGVRQNLKFLDLRYPTESYLWQEHMSKRLSRAPGHCKDGEPLIDPYAVYQSFPRTKLQLPTVLTCLIAHSLLVFFLSRLSVHFSASVSRDHLPNKLSAWGTKWTLLARVTKRHMALMVSGMTGFKVQTMSLVYDFSHLLALLYDGTIFILNTQILGRWMQWLQAWYFLPFKLKEEENETLSQVKTKQNLTAFHWFWLGDVPILEPIRVELVALWLLA